LKFKALFIYYFYLLKIKDVSKFHTSIFFVLSSLFVLLYLILSFNSRLATDDYYFIGDIRNHGMFEQVWFQYMNWSGRYAATMAANLFYNFFGLNQSYYFILPLLSLFFLFTGICLLLKTISTFFSTQLSFLQLALVSISTASFLFFMSFDIAESWFWYCGYSSYLWSIVAVVWAVYFILAKERYSVYGAIICFVYVGGASEIYSAIIGLCYTVLLIYSYVYKNKLWNNKYLFKKMLIVYSFFAIAFILFLIAPGNYLRDGLFPEHHLDKAFFITAKSFVKLFVFYLPSKLVYILGFSGVFYALGNLCSTQLANRFSFKTIAKNATLTLGVLLFIFYLLVAYVMVETGPARVLFFVSFLCVVYLISLSFLTGAADALSKYNSIIQWASFLLLAITLLFSIFNQYLITTNYAKAHDERVKNIKQLKTEMDKDSLILLKPLPFSGMVYSAEITSDTNHFTNKELKMGFDLPFHVAIAGR